MMFRSKILWNPSMFCTHNKKQSGFSLVEILITISILVVAISLAAPPLTSFIENNRMTTAANNLVSAINLARNEAIARRTTTTIAGNGNGWTVSFIPLTTTTPTAIMTYELDDGIEIDISDSNIQSSGLRFSADGYRDLSTTPATFTFLVCDPDIDFNRTVSVSAAGTTSVTKGTGGCPDGT